MPRFNPQPLPTNTDDTIEFLQNQQNEFVEVLKQPDVEGVQFTPLAVEPGKPRTGVLYYAKGGAGEWKAGSPGFYFWDGSAFRKVSFT